MINFKILKRIKNPSFPVKFGLASWVLPLVCVICAYYFIPDRGAGAHDYPGMGGFVPLFFILAAELPFFVLLLPVLYSQGSAAATPEFWNHFYPGRKLLLTIIPALALWFIIGYLVGRFCNRFSPKTQKSCLLVVTYKRLWSA